MHQIKVGNERIRFHDKHVSLWTLDQIWLHTLLPYSITYMHTKRKTHTYSHTHTHMHTYTSHILCDLLWLYWKPSSVNTSYRCWGLSMSTSACMDKTCLTPLYKDRRKTGWCLFIVLVIELIFFYVYKTDLYLLIRYLTLI